MTHTLARLAGLAAMVAALTLAPPSIAASSPGPGTTAKAKQYAKDCGPKAKRGRGADACIKAMNKLATGKSSSPRSACARVSRKRAKGKGKSAFARCVTAGSKVMKERKSAVRKAAGATDEQTDDGDAGDAVTDPDDNEADEPLAEVVLDVSLGDDLDVADLIESPDGS